MTTPAPIRTIQPNESLDTIWAELVYTEARLLSGAPKHAPMIAKLIARQADVRAGQLDQWRAEIVAQAAVDDADDGLDDLVDDLDNELVHAEKGDRGPRHRHYFKNPRNEVVRLGLASELEVVRTWPESLKGEKEKAVLKLATPFAETIAQGDDAIERRAKAGAATGAHRVREILRFIDDVNAARLGLYGQLVTLGQEQGRPANWASRFFRATQKSPKPRKAQPAADPPKS